MATYDRAALRAPPFLFFLLQKLLHAALFNELQILNHAHVIVRAVTLVQAFKTAAGKLITLVAELHQPISKEVAVLFHEGAVLSPGATAGAVRSHDTRTSQVIFHREKARANGAVHAARRDQDFFHSYILTNPNKKGKP
jgi:hypothetical protein